MRTLLQDLRYALSQLRKSPGFTLAAVLTLAIGIGANTALFSSMDAVVMHPLAVPQLDRVMAVSEEQDGRDHGSRWRNFEDWRRQSRSFEQMAVYGRANMSMTGAGDAAHVDASRTFGELFQRAADPGVAGPRLFASDAEPGRDGVAVLNYGFWQRQFGGDPKVLGTNHRARSALVHNRGSDAEDDAISSRHRHLCAFCAHAATNRQPQRPRLRSDWASARWRDRRCRRRRRCAPLPSTCRRHIRQPTRGGRFMWRRSLTT